jgi:hypothetical protein
MVVTSPGAPDFIFSPSSAYEADNFANSTGKDMRGGFENGAVFDVEWKEVEDPEGLTLATYPIIKNTDFAAFERGEGMWWDEGKVWFISTSGGAANAGQVWVYDPVTNKLIMEFESPSREIMWGPDNIAARPQAGTRLVCEDGGTNPKRLIGLTSGLDTFHFADNRIKLSLDDLAIADSVLPGVLANFWDEIIREGDVAAICEKLYETCPLGNPECDAECTAMVSSYKRSFESSEWAGATFWGDWLFVNVQSPGITFAITGPWARGAFATS